jgi:hypothetical protein
VHGQFADVQIDKAPGRMQAGRVVAGSFPILSSQALQEGGELGRARLKGREQLVAQTDAYGNRTLCTVR